MQLGPQRQPLEISPWGPSLCPKQQCQKQGPHQRPRKQQGPHQKQPRQNKGATLETATLAAGATPETEATPEAAAPETEATPEAASPETGITPGAAVPTTEAAASGTTHFLNLLFSIVIRCYLMDWILGTQPGTGTRVQEPERE